MRKRLIEFGIIFGAWTVLGIVVGGYHILRMFLLEQLAGFCLLSLCSVFWRDLLLMWCSAVLTPAVFWFCRRIPFTRARVLRTTLAHIGFFVLIWSANASLMHLLHVDTTPVSSFRGPLLELRLITTFYTDLWMYISVVAVWHVVAYYRKFRDREVQTAQLREQLAKAQLELLKAQLHPHFLFNTLNSAAAFMQDDPEAAEDMLADLAFMLRVSLRSSATQEISVRQEMSLLQAYLRIQKKRFEDRLSVVLDIAPETLEAGVPTMLLQPLVENAIRHGIAPRPGSGRVEVSAARQGDQLLLQVIDDGLGMPPGCREGVGLSNTRGRLGQLYGSQQSLRLDSKPGQGTTVTVSLPFRRCPENVLEDAYEDSSLGGGRRAARAAAAAVTAEN